MFDFQDKPYAIVIEIAVACLLSGMLYLLGTSGIISPLHPFTYFLLTPILVLLMARKRKQEQESRKDK